MNQADKEEVERLIAGIEAVHGFHFGPLRALMARAIKEQLK